ncbi:hypothetical protein MJD09_03515 [bacterium]|nr:hypothetical protein [bacterium]
MKRAKNIIVPVMSSVLLAGFALTFNACTAQSPLGLENSSEDEVVQEQTILSKPDPRDDGE